MKVIMHMDLDSYFVSAARTIDKGLKNKPVVISNGGERAIISAASYEAKKLGARVPMPLYKVKQLVPSVIVANPDFGLYTFLSSKVFEYIFNTFSKKVEVGSIDECYIDATDEWMKYGSPIKMAKAIQDGILKTLDLPCSIGISSNKFVAKMSTSINKPFGITVTKPGDFLKVFGDKDLIEFFGIGPSTKEKLNKIGIFKISELANSTEEELKPVVGIVAKQYIHQANGNGAEELDLSHNDLKGIGNEVTFQDGDKADRKDILKVLSSLVELVAQRMQNRNFAAYTICVYMKEAGPVTIKRDSIQKKLIRPIYKYTDILQETIALFDKLWNESTLKFVGVRVTELTDLYEVTYQTDIFDKEEVKTVSQGAIEKVNRALKSNALMTGSAFIAKQKKKQKQTRYIESDRIIKHFDVKENK